MMTKRQAHAKMFANAVEATENGGRKRTILGWVVLACTAALKDGKPIDETIESIDDKRVREHVREIFGYFKERPGLTVLGALWGTVKNALRLSVGLGNNDQAVFEAIAFDQVKAVFDQLRAGNPVTTTGMTYSLTDMVADQADSGSADGNAIAQILALPTEAYNDDAVKAIVTAAYEEGRIRDSRAITLMTRGAADDTTLAAFRQQQA